MQKMLMLYAKILGAVIIIAVALAVIPASSQKIPIAALYVFALCLGVAIGIHLGEVFNRGLPIPDQNLKGDTLFSIGRAPNNDAVYMWKPGVNKGHIVEFKDYMVFEAIKEALKQTPAGVLVVKTLSTEQVKVKWLWHIARPITKEIFPEVLKGYDQLNIKRKDIFVGDNGIQYHLKVLHS